MSSLGTIKKIRLLLCFFFFLFLNKPSVLKCSVEIIGTLMRTVNLLG